MRSNSNKHIHFIHAHTRIQTYIHTYIYTRVTLLAAQVIIDNGCLTVQVSGVHAPELLEKKSSLGGRVLVRFKAA